MDTYIWRKPQCRTRQERAPVSSEAHPRRLTQSHLILLSQGRSSIYCCFGMQRLRCYPRRSPEKHEARPVGQETNEPNKHHPHREIYKYVFLT